eukprot:2072900-Rhodomonas_salina.1
MEELELHGCFTPHKHVSPVDQFVADHEKRMPVHREHFDVASSHCVEALELNEVGARPSEDVRLQRVLERVTVEVLCRSQIQRPIDVEAPQGGHSDRGQRRKLLELLRHRVPGVRLAGSDEVSGHEDAVVAVQARHVAHLPVHSSAGPDALARLQLNTSSSRRDAQQQRVHIM